MGLVKTDDEVDVWRVELDQPPGLVAELRWRLGAQERARAERLILALERARFVIAHAALREVLSEFTGTPAAAIQFARARRGKPYLAGGGPRFNLSHSGGRALIAVCERHELGVDLERVCAKRNLLGLAGRYFAPGERAVLEALPQEERLRAFYRCWTRKETYMKATGAGLAMALDSFEVAFAPGAPPALLVSARGCDEPSRWRFAELAAGLEFEAAIAIEAGHGVIRQRPFDLG
jgi:4'-phosphopantetheinyl transferase